MQNEGGLSHTFLAQDAKDANILVDGNMLLPEEVHWGEFQKLIELVVECFHGVLWFYFGINIRKLRKSFRNFDKKLRSCSCKMAQRRLLANILYLQKLIYEYDSGASVG